MFATRNQRASPSLDISWCVLVSLAMLKAGPSLTAIVLTPKFHTANKNARIYDVALPTTSPARFTLLREWLRRCNESHSCNGTFVETKTFLPTRLLYVGNTNDPDSLRLVLATRIDGAKYIALSHRWGKISEDEKEEFCTTKDNVNQRLSNFDISDLPKTFQDAIKVTRELHVSYLWIDSLCIIQAGDDGKDWESEAKLMESVYSSAYCTIAATSARDMKDGFLDRKVSTEYLYVQDTSGQRFYICAGTDDFEVDVDKAELNTRAWVMQERVLSRRIIHFSANQMYWECGKGVHCENLTWMKRYELINIRQTKTMLMMSVCFLVRSIKATLRLIQTFQPGSSPSAKAMNVCWISFTSFTRITQSVVLQRRPTDLLQYLGWWLVLQAL